MIEIEFLWIPPKFGGWERDPIVGIRPQIRWQQFISESIELSRSAQIVFLEYDRASRTGRAKLKPITPEIPLPWLQPGALVELLDGYRVIAVGVIVDPQ